MTIKDRSDKKIKICCPVCGCGETDNLINRTSFSLKGAGWYKDGYNKGEK